MFQEQGLLFSELGYLVRFDHLSEIIVHVMHIYIQSKDMSRNMKSLRYKTIHMIMKHMTSWFITWSTSWPSRGANIGLRLELSSNKLKSK